ncbi:MAG TPA: glutamate-cysteine ligase family protein [Pyrinomonadaceae bacterium]|jgi:glutamate--cysteine ligase
MIAELALLEAEAEAEGASPLAAIPSQAAISRASTSLFVDHLRRGAKPQPQWKCGLEFELFGYDVRSLERLDAAQVQQVLLGLSRASGQLSYESGILTETEGLSGERLTVEPGGQVEFSGVPHGSLAELERDMRAFLVQLKEVASARGLIFLAAGFDPLRTAAEQRWFPKPRYAVMRPYLGTRGARAWDMMCRTCAIQANLDYGSEEDLAKKFILGNHLAPVVTAIFANSPFEDGAPSGYKSTRAAVWLETDTARAGCSPPSFDEGFSIQDFVAYTLSVPIIFTRRDKSYSSEASGLEFGAFLDGCTGGARPVFQDWTDHLTTIFTEARLKQYIELRSADCGKPSMAMALQALWKGLMYDGATLDEALRLAPKLDQVEMRTLQESVARHALEARHAGVDVLGLARETISLAAEGLGRIAPAELKYLDALRELVFEDEACPADILLRNWHGSWHGSVERLIDYLRTA